jgi:hypothetical protein
VDVTDGLFHGSINITVVSFNVMVMTYGGSCESA